MLIVEEIIKKYSKKKNVEKGKMFGSETLKVNGSVFFIKTKDGIVFKLDSVGIEKALSIKGADYFDAHKNGKKMKDWIHIPEKAIQETCLEVAELGYKFVGGLTVQKNRKKI